MKSAIENQASLRNLVSPNLPPVMLNIPVEYQFCVNAGVLAAEAFFDEITAIGLHDHIATCMHAFLRPVRSSTAAAGGMSPSVLQGCTDAFAAGYLGRIQQELRIFRDSGCGGAPHGSREPPGSNAWH